MAKVLHVRGAKGSPHIFFATISYTSDVGPAYLASLLYSLPALQQAGIGYDYWKMDENCHVDDARNSALRDFLQTDCDALVFLDADIGWRSDDLINLARNARDIVAGVYPKKSDDPEYPVQFLAGDIWSDADGLIEVEGAPTGFMRISRRVAEKLTELNAHRRFFEQKATADSKPITIVFERTYEDARRFSGDYAFCRNAREAGFKVFVDPEMLFAHTGQKEWQGCLGSHLRGVAGIEHPKLFAAISELRKGQNIAEAIDVLTRYWGNRPYAAVAEYLVAIYLLASDAKGPILETGSGVSTLVLGAAAERAGVEHWVLEDDVGWARRVQSALHQAQLSKTFYRYAPLIERDGEIRYSAPPDMPECFSLVACDGPEVRFGRGGLFKLFSDATIVVMDDAQHSHVDLLRDWAKARGRGVTIMGEERKFALCAPLTTG
jgi:hypothetical protein